MTYNTVYLHNAFLLAIMKNAHLNVPVPDASEKHVDAQTIQALISRASKKRKLNDSLALAQQRKKHRTREVMSLDQEDRQKIIAASKIDSVIFSISSSIRYLLGVDAGIECSGKDWRPTVTERDRTDTKRMR